MVFDSLFSGLESRLKGLPYILTGAGIIYLSDYFPEHYKGIGRAVGLGVLGYGAYQMLVKPQEEKYIPPAPGVYELKAAITDPHEGEEWSCLILHTINATIYNPYDKPFMVYAYCLAYHEDTETLYFVDSPKEVKLDPHGDSNISFKIKFNCTHMRGKWRTWILLLNYPDTEHLREHFVGSSNIVHFNVGFR